MRRNECSIAISRKATLSLVIVLVAVFGRLSAGHERGAALALPISTAVTAISGEDVAKQIDLLSNDNFAAQDQLIAWAGESLENFQLVRAIVDAYLAGQIDIETRRRLASILLQTGSLGATITIDDRTDSIKVASDGGDETKIVINDQLERVEIQNPFFGAFDGPTKLVVLFGAGLNS